VKLGGLLGGGIHLATLRFLLFDYVSYLVASLHLGFVVHEYIMMLSFVTTSRRVEIAISNGR
jgi:hypothetical protein